MQMILKLYPDKFADVAEVRGNFTLDEYSYWVEHKFHLSAFSKMATKSLFCHQKDIIAKVSKIYTIYPP